MSYHHLSAEERTSILYCSQDGLSGREIARSLGRSPATISRELRRGKPIWSAFYNDYYAHHQALVRRHRARHRRRADQARLLAYVHNKLGACWSPETIANRLALNYPATTTMRISAEPVYQWVFADARSGATLYRALRRAHRRRRRQGRLARAKRGIRDRIGIA
jgi:IS30 family transposase